MSFIARLRHCLFCPVRYAASCTVAYSIPGFFSFFFDIPSVVDYPSSLPLTFFSSPSGCRRTILIAGFTFVSC